MRIKNNDSSNKNQEQSLQQIKSSAKEVISALSQIYCISGAKEKN